ELGTEGSAGARVTLAKNAVVRAILAQALPDDDEVPREIRGNGWKDLVAGRVCVHPELGAGRKAGTGVALAVKAVDRTILSSAGPHDDEVAGCIQFHRCAELKARGVCVD